MRQKVLLINPASGLISRSWAYRQFFTPIAPLGLCYVSAVLRRGGIEVSVIDQFASRFTEEGLVKVIVKEKPTLVGFSCLTPVLPDIRKTVSAIRSSGLDTRVVLGNIHASCFPEELLKDGSADIVVRGEGETTMLELCRALEENKPLAGVPGLSFRDGPAGVIHNPNRLKLEELDELPFPAWDLLDMDGYTDVPLAAIIKARAFPIMASRGCPYRCYYCSQDKLYSKVRYRDFNKVADEMEYFADKFNVKFFGFSDAYFPFDEASGLEFCRVITGRKLHRKLRWCTETRVDKVTPRLLKAMKEAGVHLIMYGVEVGNQRVLDFLNKNTTLEQAREALKETRKAGILSQGLFILGLPQETRQTCLDTIRFAKELDCDIVKFNIAMPYPGSKFFDDYVKKNANAQPEKFTSWIDWTDDPGELLYVPEGMDSSELRYLQRKAMFDFYVRPRIIFRNLRRGSISLPNLFSGGIWLIWLLLRAFISRPKKSRQHRPE